MINKIISIKQELPKEDIDKVIEITSRFNWNMYNKLMYLSGYLYEIHKHNDPIGDEADDSSLLIARVMNCADKVERNSWARAMYWYAIHDIMGETIYSVAKRRGLIYETVKSGIVKFRKELQKSNITRSRYEHLKKMANV